MYQVYIIIERGSLIPDQKTCDFFYNFQAKNSKSTKWRPFYGHPPPKTVRIWLTSNSDCLRQRASQPAPSAPAGMCPIKDVREILLRKISLLSDLSPNMCLDLKLDNGEMEQTDRQTNRQTSALVYRFNKVDLWIRGDFVHAPASSPPLTMLIYGNHFFKLSFSNQCKIDDAEQFHCHVNSDIFEIFFSNKDYKKGQLSTLYIWHILF